MTPTKTMKIHDYNAFGKLIRDWAKNPESQPANIQEFRQAAAGIMTLNGYCDEEGVDFINMASDKLTILVPNSADLEQPLPTQDWPLPTFYSRLAFNHEEPHIRAEEREEFKNSRIGDYATAKCM